MSPQITNSTRRFSDGSLYVYYTDGSLRRLACEPSGKQRGHYPTERGMRRDIAMFERQKHFKQPEPQAV